MLFFKAIALTFLQNSWILGPNMRLSNNAETIVLQKHIKNINWCVWGFRFTVFWNQHWNTNISQVWLWLLKQSSELHKYCVVLSNGMTNLPLLRTLIIQRNKQTNKQVWQKENVGRLMNSYLSYQDWSSQREFWWVSLPYQMKKQQIYLCWN